MPRSLVRVSFILILTLLAIFAPLIYSGYSELTQASLSNSDGEAAQHYQTAAQRIPWRADLYELAGHRYYHAKDYDQADAAYQKAFSRHRLSPEGWVAWGDVNYLNGQPERAMQLWNQALQEKKTSDALYSRLAEGYQANGDFTKATEYLEKYVSVHAGEASAHYRLGLLLALSDPQQAVVELKNASQLDPQFASAVETLCAALEPALQIDASSERLVMIGRGLGLVNEWKLARAAFAAAVEKDKKNAEAWAWLGEANQQIGVVGGGNEELDQALKLNPNSATVRGLRGLYFQRTGNYRQALAEFQFAAAQDPQNPTWFVSVGEAYAKNGDLIRALESYQAATNVAPKEASYWQLLAGLCAQNNINIEDVGIPAAQKAVVLTKSDPNALDMLGWLLLLDARYEEAERTLKRALEFDPQNASIHLHLGMLYQQTEQRGLAYEHLAQARDLGNAEAASILEQYFP
jgi:tetratricopeptide (TPR) repeat protein